MNQRGSPGDVRMLLSVSVWSGNATDITPETRDFFHWLSALIALPTVAYAGRPFVKSAFGALAAGRLNMGGKRGDVFAVPEYLACGNALLTRDCTQGGRLADTVASHQARHLSGFRCQRNTLECLRRAIKEIDVFDFEHYFEPSFKD